MKPLSDYHVWLEAPKGTQAIFRQVLIQSAGLKSASVLYAYATSVIVISRLPEMVREGLDSEAGGLGMLLLHSQLETRRDLLWYGMERVSDLPSQIAHLSGQLFISRTYRIVSGGKPMMLINERFPLGIEN
jgi:chorismate-pyruvate lyase